MRFIFSTLLLSLFATFSFADEHSHGGADMPGVEVVTLTDAITMIQAGGGNIAVFTGEDGAFVVDDGLEEASELVAKSVEAVAGGPVEVLVNTHWHFDHTGNNGHFHSHGATIYAHDNVRKRMAAGQYIAPLDLQIAPAAPAALPSVTFAHPITLHLNGESVLVIPVKPAHTDGDSIVVWPGANVVHTGDLYFNGFWPFIDAGSGGSIEGMIRGVDAALAHIDEDTKIIPGHGPVANVEDLRNYQSVLKTVAARVSEAKAAGKSLEEFIGENPLSDFDAEWGGGFLKTDNFISIIW